MKFTNKSRELLNRILSFSGAPLPSERPRLPDFWQRKLNISTSIMNNFANKINVKPSKKKQIIWSNIAIQCPICAFWLTASFLTISKPESFSKTLLNHKSSLHSNPQRTKSCSILPSITQMKRIEFTKGNSMTSMLDKGKRF